MTDTGYIQFNAATEQRVYELMFAIMAQNGWTPTRTVETDNPCPGWWWRLGVVYERVPPPLTVRFRHRLVAPAYTRV